MKTNTAIWDNLAAGRRKGKEKEGAKAKKAKKVKEEEKETETQIDEQADTEKEEVGVEMVQESEEVPQGEPEEVPQNEAEAVVQSTAEEGTPEEASGEKTEADRDGDGEMLPRDTEHTPDEDSAVKNEETPDDSLPAIFVGPNGRHKSKEIATPNISSSTEMRKQKVLISNGHDDSLSVASRRSSRLKVPEDLAQEPPRRVTRYSSLASIPFVVSRSVLTANL